MKKKIYAFIDASNIIYGTRDEGWKVDFKKLYKYLKERYTCNFIYYFAGEDKNSPKQKSFYKKLSNFGYKLVLREVKIYHQLDGTVVRKANCDVDLTFYVMRELDEFSKAIFFTGDGDFLILMKYLIKQGKKILIISNGKRTAREIKNLVKDRFIDLKSLKELLVYKKR